MTERTTSKQAFIHKKSLCLGKNIQMVLIYFKMPNAIVLRDWFPLYTNVWEIQQKLAANINTNAQNLILKSKGSQLDPWIPLAGLEYEDKLLFVFDVEVIDDTDGKFGKMLPENVLRVVKVLNKDNKWVELNVDIAIENVKKPWLGGFRNKITKAEYHHATVQTETVGGRRHKFGQAPPVTMDGFSQTRKYHPKDTGCQTRHDHGTQMPVLGLYSANYKDRIVDPGIYKEHVELCFPELPLTVLNKFKNICMELIKRSKDDKIRMKRKEMLKEKMKMLQVHSQRADWDFTISTIYPTDRYGIENLYVLINNWYDHERKKLIESFVFPTSPGFKACLLNVFKKKVSYLRQIDVLKTKQRDESLKKQRIQFFDEAAKPKIRYYPKGNITVIETCSAIKSKILKELYSCYTRRDYKPEERVEMLLQLKCNVENTIPIDLALPLIELLNREIDMMSMGMKHLEGLRKRITEMLFYLFTSKEVFGKAPWDSDETINYTTTRCISCNELKPSKAFIKRNINSRHCKSCLWLLNRNTGVPPLGPYKFMLAEMRKCLINKKHSILDIIKPHEIFRLVNKVWNGKSALSGNRDPFKLWLARWDVQREWTPWNCILLTKDEVQIHEQVENPETFYEQRFIFEVKRKHIEAKMEFKKLHADYLQWKADTDKVMEDKAKRRKEEYFKTSDPFFQPAEFCVRNKLDTGTFDENKLYQG
ncbi:IQ motif and ubiquitin-like domain-containing protein [Halyomorpha halys]|uniref:IQ motif and ubiquitin-like domain-containing protein n=1 Tax=Halyomorpha halys TaxID=286706 RepID=UPI0006D507E5|nr:IQ and ubiquitin-like domain-containing protein [Halyomorpha halys]